MRKCLQVELVPIIRPYVNTDCKKIKETAFATHSPCYLAPYPGEPSICDIPLKDWGQVFWTIKGAFLKEMFATLKGMLSVTLGCTKNALTNALKNAYNDVKEFGMRLLKLTWRKIKSIGKRSIANDPTELANSVAEQLAEQLKWNENGVIWFPFISDSSDYETIENETIENEETIENDVIENETIGVTVYILLGSRPMYDVDANDKTDVNMNKVVDDIAEKIGSEKLHLSFGKDLNLTNFTACLDFECKETYHGVIPKLSTTTSGVKEFYSVNILILISFLINPMVKQILQ